MSSLQVCVATRHFSAALPVLSTPILHIETSVSPLTYNDNLIYHYAGGIALGALKKWREAEEFFEICASSPGQAPAAIQLEALKKLTLVQLILYGKVKSLNLLKLLRCNLWYRRFHPPSTLTRFWSGCRRVHRTEI